MTSMCIIDEEICQPLRGSTPYINSSSKQHNSRLSKRNHAPGCGAWISIVDLSLFALDRCQATEADETGSHQG